MTIYSKAPFKHVTEFNNSTIEELFSTPEFKAAVLAAAGGGGLEGTNYIYVAANGTDVENATELQAAYTAAQGLSPSASNRITIVGAPGYYNFGSTPFIMNTDYIDLVSLDGNRSIIFNSGDSNGTIILDFVSSVYVKGVDVQTKAFQVETYYPTVTIENCKGGDYSFSSTFFNMGSKFINCEGGDFSFGDTNNSTNSFGTFIDCVAGNYSFGKDATGTFTNCTAGGYSFGFYGNASGTFQNCVANIQSFGFFGDANGIFTNCQLTNGNGFGFAGNTSGTFTNCTGGLGSFGYAGTASGTFTNCIGLDYSFGAYTAGALSGVAQYCVGGNYSFGGGPGGSQGTLDGYLYFCRLTNGTFRTVSGAGKTRYCIDGNNTANNQG